MIRYSLKSRLINAVLRHAYLTALGISLAILGIGYLFFLGPYYQKVLVFQQQSVEASRAKIAEQKKYLSALQDVEKYYHSLEQDVVESIRLAVPDENGISELYTQLEAMALSNGMALEAVDFAPLSVDRKNEYQTLNGTLQLSGGSYEQFKAFVGSVERNLRVMNIVSMKYAPDAVLYTIDFQVFYLLNEESL